MPLRVLLACLIWITALAPLPALAEEAIRSFASNVVLSRDGSVNVTETIEVRAEGIAIRRGIFRDIPTVLVNDDGSLLRSNLEVISVQKNGVDEPWFTQSITNGLRIYIGESDVYLDPGTYRYTLTYTMTRMARRFEDHDELFWNATGNFWDFPIQSATATITLPQGAVIEQLIGYTGVSGSTEQAVAITRTADNTAFFRSLRVLSPGEGMSVAASFNKGILTEPDTATQLLYFLSDHRGQILPAIAVFLVLLYNFFAWDSVGRDPKRGVIIPLFHPPQGYSPALVHYIHRMGWKGAGWTGFTAALINLAVKGLITIDKVGKDTRFTVTGTQFMDLPPGEAVVFGYLRAKGTVAIDKDSGPDFNTKRSEFIKAIESENRTLYFNNNTGYVIAGFVLSLACLGVLVLAGVLDPFWLILSVIAGVMIGLVSSGLHRFWAGSGITRFVRLIAFGIIGVNVLAQFGSIAGLHFDGFSLAADAPVIAAISVVVINVVFAVLMRAPTVQGRRIMDQIDGFKMYLETAEKERLNFVDEPDMTVKRFEAILPFAIALGVEKPWTERFEADLARHAVADAATGVYHPIWYHGTGFRPGTLSRDVAALSSGMSAAMIAAQPASSSSSGFGGGGSGGGGGGGGGGGW